MDAIDQERHIMGIRTITEYVYGEAIVDRLRRRRVDDAQG
jgi:hypothetical protein